VANLVTTNRTRLSRGKPRWLKPRRQLGSRIIARRIHNGDDYQVFGRLGNPHIAEVRVARSLLTIVITSAGALIAVLDGIGIRNC
jgi:hypothetical protein